MPKERRLRRKRHLPGVKPMEEDSKDDVPPIPEEILSKKSFVAFPEAPKEGSVSKKAKRKQRRKKWLEKFDTSHLASTKTKKKPKKSIVSDLETIKSAIMEVEEEMTKHSKPTKEEPAKTKTRKARHRILETEKDKFKRVLEHEAYKKNPLEAILTHVRLTNAN
ncbi:ribosome biogenesis protein SLX9 homolog [Oscarella lobularis]|uniref:ribosome biogenesis protein SLX9 homolog n=1 Tax=Oscarella lobularis TaxID=121494 RepID=UPI003313B66D